MARTALSLALAQLSGGLPWGTIILGSSSLFICRYCGTEYRIEDGLDPCAFCNDCKDAVLDELAKALIKRSKR